MHRIGMLVPQMPSLPAIEEVEHDSGLAADAVRRYGDRMGDPGRTRPRTSCPRRGSTPPLYA